MRRSRKKASFWSCLVLTASPFFVVAAARGARKLSSHRSAISTHTSERLRFTRAHRVSARPRARQRAQVTLTPTPPPPSLAAFQRRCRLRRQVASPAACSCARPFRGPLPSFAAFVSGVAGQRRRAWRSRALAGGATRRKAARVVPAALSVRPQCARAALPLRCRLRATARGAARRGARRRRGRVACTRAMRPR